MKDDITVLIPAYNAEKTIGGTIDAILKQTYDQKLIKLIICNDGSKDNTLNVLKKYQDKLGDDKIQIIDQQNKGVSVTREILLKDVKTKWCCFCDADDLYMPNAFSEMVKCIKSDTDIVVSKTIWYKPHTFLRGMFANLFSKNYTLKKYIHNCDYCYMWNKLYKYEFVKTQQLYFPDRVKMWEDLFVSTQLLQNNPKIAFCIKHTYRYVKGSSSGNISLNVKDTDCQNFVLMYKWIYKNIKNEELVKNFFLKCSATLKYIKKTSYIEQLGKIYKPNTKKLTWWRKITSII